MPTVIDSFIVELQLDPTKFDSGRRQAEDAYDKTKLAAVKTGKELEEQNKKLAEGFGAVKTNVLGLFAAFTGIGITAFTAQMIHADAATGRAAHTIDMTTKGLAIWEGAAELAGAKAGSLTAGFTSLTTALQTAALTGDASIGAKFRQLFNIDIAGPNGLKTASELYLEIAKRAEGMDPAKATTAMKILGVPADVIPLLLQGRDRVRELLADVAKLGPATDADAAAAVRFENAWTRAWKGIQGAARGFYPVLTDIGNAIAIALSPKALDLLAQRWRAVKAFFVSSPADYDREQAKFLQMQQEFLAWQKGAGGQAFIGEGQQKLLAQVGTGGAFKSQAEKEAYIRAEAARLGIDPDQAMRVAKSEGFDKFVGDQGTSFGAFQLHYRNNIPGLSNSGLGDAFTRDTGLDARNPENERATITYALRKAAAAGWGDWHGWRGDPRAGISGLGAGFGAGGVDNSSSSSSRTSITIGTINVNAPKATDANGIAAGIRDAMKGNLYTPQADGGPH